MDNIRVEKEDIEFGLFCGKFACRSGAGMEIAKIEFEEMDVVFTGLLSQVFDSSLGLFFATSSQVDLCIVLRDSLRIASAFTKNTKPVRGISYLADFISNTRVSTRHANHSAREVGHVLGGPLGLARENLLYPSRVGNTHLCVLNLRVIADSNVR